MKASCSTSSLENLFPEDLTLCKEPLSPQRKRFCLICRHKVGGTMSSKMSALTVSSNDHNNNPGFPYGLQWKCSDSAISVTGVGVCLCVNG